MRIDEVIARLPTVSFKKLFHVGSLDSARKRSGSYEGAGLSVSTHPDAWRRIARGYVVGDTYRATKDGNVFLAAHKLSKQATADIAKWAVENKLLEPAVTYRVSYYDDELESEVYSDFDSLEAAEYEANDPSEIKEIQGGYKATQKLQTLTNNPRIAPTGILEYVLPLYAEQQGYDGVWWQDKLAPEKYSAPRGVIVPSKVASWTFTKIE